MRTTLPPGPAVALFLTACISGDPLGPTVAFSPATVFAGNEFSCAAGPDQRVRCWGANPRGQLGDGTTLDHISPARVGGDLPFVTLGIHGQGNHACALTVDGEAWCWGENDFGQLGTGSTDPSTMPVRVATDVRFRTISAGWRMTCAVSTTDEAWCWGRGSWGQMGNGTLAHRLTPSLVDGDHRFATVKAGTNNLVCGLTLEGEVWCWGLGILGALGRTAPEQCTLNALTLPCARTPGPVTGHRSFVDIAVGNTFACAVESSGTLWCWGANGSGQLGVTGITPCSTNPNLSGVPCTVEPVAVALSGIVRASAGDGHACAVDTDGRGFCWGRNRFGELGNGEVNTVRSTPVAVAGNHIFRTISAGTNHTCGSDTDGTIFCWGVNDRGQIGDGTLRLTLTPSRVLILAGGP